MTPRPPDWQLPPGVTRGLWEYLHDPTLAQQYLSKVNDSPFAKADQLFVQHHLPTPCKVIDLGCGPGRTLFPLYQRNFDCTGVDLSQNMLDEARKTFAHANPSLAPLSLPGRGAGGEGFLLSAAPSLIPESPSLVPLSPGGRGVRGEGERRAESERQSPNPQLLQANLATHLPLKDHTFDAALCLFGTLGMLHPEATRHNFLKEVHRILKPNGKFLLHVHNHWPIQGFFKRNSVVTMPVHQGISNLQMKLYTLTEIKKELKVAGFTITDCQFLDAKHPEGRYTGTRWLAPFRADGFLLAARSGSPPYQGGVRGG